jgi:diguanylate cyclase (GGDEF)-like protein
MGKAPPPSALTSHQRLEAELAIARERIRQLEAQIETDEMLNILNRRGLERELKRAFAHIKRYKVKAGLIFLDLDDFKSINDRHGHLAGDEILKIIAEEISAHVRKSDVVGRFGGDEFVIMLWNATADGARAKAHALEKTIASLKISFSNMVIPVSVSAGTAILRPNDDAASAVGRADADMYEQKRRKNRSCHPYRPMWSERVGDVHPE